ncbi:AEC family transporter [Enterococcus sp. 669A]|uniref:AEC family transporter n=1 Tax=Candidatus Enterococcus moelleringii TaxID=2815325 RepID=A0ABS3LBT7_9ENTE|nr:AEC family transporter [Enterococcus sp. 669A]
MGLVMARKEWLGKEVQANFSVLITNFALPCAVFNSFQIEYSEEILGLIFRSLALAVVFFTALYLLSLLFARVFRIAEKIRSIWIGCSTFSSVLFIGIPIVSALFGEIGLVILIAFNTIGNLFLFGLGESIFAGRMLVSPRKILSTPAIIAAVLGFLFFVFQITVPEVVSTPLQAIAGFTTPLAMMINGALLSKTLSPRLFTNLSTLQFCFVRLIVIPIILIFFFKVFVTDPLLLQIVALVSCMPSGAVNSVFAEKYSGQGQIASEFIIVSTLLSIVTIPTIFYLVL